MSEKITRKSRLMLFALLGLVAVAALTMWGCGTDGYSDPNASVTTTKTANALIDAETLKEWIDQGKVNSRDPASKDKVVVVTVAKAAEYNTQHIPGALLMNSDTELLMNRMEGATGVGTMVLDGPSIDNCVKKLGIDENTTIVFVASKNANALNPARAYFTFRYWGFPKERLKVLNGGENAWETAAAAGAWPASYALNATAPTVTSSTFSVKDLYQGSTANFGVRSSIGEMISVVDKINAGTVTTGASGVSILDVRGPFGNGALPTIYIKHSGVDNFGQYANTGAGNTSTYKPAADLIARLNGFGVTPAKSMNYVYCASGVRAASVFFVMDGILGWPVTLYDGSWNQWSAYTSLAAPSKVGAAWQTDLNDRTENAAAYTYPRSNPALPTDIGASLPVDPFASSMFGITDPRANQILNEDKAYFTSGGTPPAQTGGAGGGSLC